MKSLSTAVFAVGLLIPVASTAAAVDDNVVQDPRQAIWEVLERRQSAADTADAVWSAELLRAGAAASSSRGPLDPEGPRPKEMSQQVDRLRLAVSGQRGRHEYVGVSYVEEKDGKTVRTKGELGRMVVAFDGRVEQHFTDASDRERLFGQIRETSEFSEWENIHLRALVLAFRPLHPQVLGETPDRWRVEDQRSVVDGRQCITLINRTDNRVRRIHFDVDREFVPLRFAGESAGRPSFQVDMRYDRTESPAWVPSSWTATLYYFGDPNSFESTRSALETIELGQQIPAETFTIDFPPETKLTVNVAGQPDNVVVAEDGRRVPRRQVIAETTAANASRWPWFIAAIGVAALGSAILLWRRYARTV